jgi:glutamine amidotransferase PdxT
MDRNAYGTQLDAAEDQADIADIADDNGFASMAAAAARDPHDLDHIRDSFAQPVLDRLGLLSDD